MLWYGTAAISIYSSHELITVMTDEEWTRERVPPPIGLPGDGGRRRGRRGIEEFAAIEFPRENVAWILRTAEVSADRAVAKEEKRAERPTTRSRKSSRSSKP